MEKTALCRFAFRFRNSLSFGTGQYISERPRDLFSKLSLGRKESDHDRKTVQNALLPAKRRRALGAINLDVRVRLEDRDLRRLKENQDGSQKPV